MEKENLLCKIFGHKYSDVDLTILSLKVSALNSQDLKKEIECERCGEILDITKLEGLNNQPKSA